MGYVPGNDRQGHAFESRCLRTENQPVNTANQQEFKNFLDFPKNMSYAEVLSKFGGLGVSIPIVAAPKRLCAGRKFFEVFGLYLEDFKGREPFPPPLFSTIWKQGGGGRKGSDIR